MIGGNAHARRAEEFDSAISGRATGASEERYAELLDAVRAMRQMPRPVARAEFVSDLRTQLMTAAAAMPAQPVEDAVALRLTPKQRRGSRERRVAALLGGFAVVAASGSMAVASQSALPGDTLYPVKRAIENAHANLETSPAAKASVLLDNANTRLSEVEDLSNSGGGDATEISSTLQAFKDQTSQASAIAIDDFASSGDDAALSAVRTFASSSMGRLTALDNVLPISTRPALVAAAQTVRSIDAAAYNACPTCTDGQVTQLPQFATQTLSAHLKSPLISAITKGVTSTTKGTKGTKTTTSHPTTSPSDSPSASATTSPNPGSLLPTSLPTVHHGIVSGTINELTKDLLGTPSATATTSSSDTTTSVVKSLTNLLGLN